MGWHRPRLGQFRNLLRPQFESLEVRNLLSCDSLCSGNTIAEIIAIGNDSSDTVLLWDGSSTSSFSIQGLAPNGGTTVQLDSLAYKPQGTQLGLLTNGGLFHAETIEWSTIGDAGNAPDVLSTVNNPDNLLFGSVDYVYRISKHEVTNAQYVEFLNEVAASDPFALYDTRMGSSTRAGITRSGSSGSYTYAVKATAIGQGPGGTDYAYADKPVVFVCWYDTIRFANWLTSGTTESGTYTISGGGPNSGTVAIPDHSTLPAGSFFLPTEDEWYKAAYYDGSTGTYFDYAAGSDTVPNNNLPTADTGNSANFTDGGETTGDTFYPLTDVGDYLLSVSPNGTFDQGGNVREWNETLVNNQSGPFRGLRGGAWGNAWWFELASTYRYNAGNNNPASSSYFDGFRIASSVPEQSPTEVQIDSNTVFEEIIGQYVGVLTAIDEDVGQTQSFESLDNRFQVIGNELWQNPTNSFPLGSAGTIDVIIKVTDSGDPPLSVELPLTLQVTPVDSPWKNQANPFDVNADGFVSPIDVLFLVNYLNGPNDNALNYDSNRPFASGPFWDPSGDRYVTPLDALMVINYINNNDNGEGEAEFNIDIAQHYADFDIYPEFVRKREQALLELLV